MKRTVCLMVIALAGAMTGGGVSAAYATHVAPTSPQVAPVPAPPAPTEVRGVTSRVGPVRTVRSGGVDYQVYRDAANGRLRLVTPAGRREYFR